MTDSPSRRGRLNAAQEGDSVENIAYEEGFFWKTVWEHPQNADLRTTRKGPHQLVPGDEVYVPELREKDVPAATGRRHTFRRHGVPSTLRLVFRTEGKPRGGVPYAVEIDGVTVSGVIAGDGSVQVFLVPNAKAGRIRVGEGLDAEIFNLQLRQLQPITEPAGLQARLDNLGFGTDLVEGVRRYQEARGMAVNGEINDDLRHRIADEHGC
jgi:hypothetical protein